MVAEKFQIYSVKITENTFVNQKIESVHFYSGPQAKLCPMCVSFVCTKINNGIGHKF